MKLLTRLRVRAPFFMSACIGLFCWITATVASAQSSTQNAASVPAKDRWVLSASSTQAGNYDIKFIADDNLKTRWSSEFSDPQWLQIDLGRTATVSGFRLHWEDAFSSKYRVQASLDANNWKTVYESHNADGKIDDVYIRPMSARFLRLEGLQRATGWGHSLWEIDVKGLDEQVIVSATESSGEAPQVVMDGDLETVWQSKKSDSTTLKLDFGKLIKFRGLRIDWGEVHAQSIAMKISKAGNKWVPVAAIKNGSGKFDFLTHGLQQARYVEISLSDANHRGRGFQVREISLRATNEVFTPLKEYQSAAKKAPAGYYPMHLRDQQTYWTLVGLPEDTAESLFDEYGNVEPKKNGSTLMPYVYMDDTLYSAVAAEKVSQSLANDYLPLPVVEWQVKPGVTFKSEAITRGNINASISYVRYTLANDSKNAQQGKIYAVIRPIQINPVWQHGGISAITRINYKNSALEPLKINGRDAYVPLSQADSFVVHQFNQGDVIGTLAGTQRPPSSLVFKAGAKATINDLSDKGFLSAALSYNFNLQPGEQKQLIIAMPLHDDFGGLKDFKDFDQHREEQVSFWQRKLDLVGIDLADKAIVNTIKSQMAYILINQDGVATQPGSRNYNRVWMRDGAMTSSALLRLGHFDEVRRYLDWYADKVKQSGLVPPILTTDGSAYHGYGADIEWDSQGQFIYAMMEYYRFTGDKAFLARHFDAIYRALKYLVVLRDKTLHTRLHDGEYGDRVRGILPQSISHEGFSTPHYSYWDDFWAIRGWLDGIEAAQILEKPEIAQWASEHQQRFSDSVKQSIVKTIAWKNLDYVPGEADIGTPDPTSIAIALFPTRAEHLLPTDTLKKTFEDYFHRVKRLHDSDQPFSYTPYEVRNILALASLGYRQEASELHEMLFSDRRPANWNQFGEVVHSDYRKGAYIGDMPHTWVGAAYVNSVRGMLLMEDDVNKVLHLLPTTPEQWMVDTGVRLENFPTHFGNINMHAHWDQTNRTLRLDYSGGDSSTEKIFVRWPMGQTTEPLDVQIDGSSHYQKDNKGVWITATNFKLLAKW